MRAFLALAPLALITASAQAASSTVMLKSASGPAGTAVLTDAPKGLLIHIEASGLTPGWHAIHIHEKGDCSDAAFKMAGAHVHAMTPAVHGLLNPAANDQGDLPNIYAAADGSAKADLFTATASLSGAIGAKLLDADGSAIVIHAKPDDYTTQPIGGAGDRVVCGIVK